MYFTPYSRWSRAAVWLLWFLMLLVLAWGYGLAESHPGPIAQPQRAPLLLAGVVTPAAPQRLLFPWQPRSRWRKQALARYRAARRAYRRAVWTVRWAYWRTLWAAGWARLMLQGALTMATVIDGLTQAQLRHHLGALPVLYALLEVLQVREIINRHCATQAEVDHGTVAVVLILNRLTAPRPLYQVADWLAQTVLAYTLGVPATKFNDDRLGRTLEVRSQHAPAIWQDIVHRALVQAEIDLTLIFYDLTACVVHGAYTESQHIDFGFAHNTPMNKRKFKVGLNATADGHFPAAYALWSGRTADQATVQENMTRLCRLLQRHGYPVSEVTIIGDRANLNDELALAYDRHDLRYLAGLQPRKKVHRELVVAVPEQQFYAYPLTAERGPAGYWGVPCPVVFKHQGQQVTHRGLVVLSGPMRRAHRQTRAAQLWTLRHNLRTVRAKIGQPYYRTVKAVQKRANTQLKQSPAGKFMQAEAYTDETGPVRLRWWINRYALWQAQQRDGRYLLVTNDWSLSPRRMLARYRQKDGVEKRIRVTKSDLRVSPIYLHKDQRLEGMLLVNMLALLAYSVLERQVRQGGLQMTTRQIIAQLESLTVIETQCWDGSRLHRLVPVDEEQAALLAILAHIVAELRFPRWPHLQLPAGNTAASALPPPRSGWHAAA
jgi:transposase